MTVKQFNTEAMQNVGVGFYKGSAFVVVDKDGFFDAQDIQEGIFDSGILLEGEYGLKLIDGLRVIARLVKGDETENLLLINPLEETLIHEVFGYEERELTHMKKNCIIGSEEVFDDLVLNYFLEDEEKPFETYELDLRDMKVDDSDPDYHFILEVSDHVALELERRNVAEASEPIFKEIFDTLVSLKQQTI